MVEDIGSFVRPVSIETEDDRFAVGTSNYLRVFAEDRERSRARIARQALDRLENWSAPVGCAAITHDSGRFFSIHGLADHSDRRWPVIKQPEIGILGILATRIRGVLHVLMQHKMEPGNIGGVQLSPTVQATRSNYRRIHGGGAVPYLDFFTALGMRNGARGRRVLVDSLQTEQSSLFYRKRNRNIVIEVNEEVPERPGWHWLGLDQLLGLLTIDDVVNMEARSVLCALAAEVRSAGGGLAIGGAQGTTLGDGRADREQAKHSIRGILGWITAGRSEPPQQSELVSLRELEGWSHTGELITHDSGKTFSIIGVSVRSSDREVSGWDQPMISVGADGVIGLLITEIGESSMFCCAWPAKDADSIPPNLDRQCSSSPVSRSPMRATQTLVSSRANRLVPCPARSFSSIGSSTPRSRFASSMRWPRTKADDSIAQACDTSSSSPNPTMNRPDSAG